TEAAADKANPIISHRNSVRDDNLFGLPGQNPVEGGARPFAVQERRSPVARRARMGTHDSAESRHESFPALEPVWRKILDEIGEDRRSAFAVKKYRLRHRKAAPYDHLIDVCRPFGWRRILKQRVDGCFHLALLEFVESIRAGLRKGLFPLGKKQVMDL